MSSKKTFNGHHQERQKVPVLCEAGDAGPDFEKEDEDEEDDIVEVFSAGGRSASSMRSDARVAYFQSRSPSGFRPSPSENNALVSLHNQVKGLLSLRQDNIQKVREREAYLAKLTHNFDRQEKHLMKLQLHVTKTKEQLAKKNEVFHALEYKMHKKEKELKSFLEERKATEGSILELERKLKRLNEANNDLEAEIAKIDGKVGTMSSEMQHIAVGERRPSLRKKSSEMSLQYYD